MANYRINGKIYRDVEKMSLDDLQAVRQAITRRMVAIGTLGMKLNRSPAAKPQIDRYNAELDDLRLKDRQIDVWAKAKVKAGVVSDMAKVAAEPAVAAQLDPELAPNRTLPIEGGFKRGELIITAARSQGKSIDPETAKAMGAEIMEGVKDEQ